MKIQYKLSIKRVGKKCRETYTYGDLEKALDYYELEVGKQKLEFKPTKTN
jgi:hypothetical protein